jgi:hypothetical protein
MTASCLPYFDEDIFEGPPFIGRGANDIFSDIPLDFDIPHDQNENSL